MSTLNGIPITSAKVFLPAWGVWWADVEVSEPDALSGAATLVISDQTYVGTIASGAALDGRGRYRVAGGAGAWGEVLTAKSYNNDAGVKASLIIQDAAAEAGETVEDAPADRVGTHYARSSNPASDVLHYAARDAWYVDVDGVTRFGSRAEFDYAGDGTVRVIDSAQGVFEIATDSVAGLVPGLRAGGFTASDIEIDVSPGAIRVRGYSKKTADVWRALADRLLPQARYLGTWEYRVVSQSGERLNLQTVRVASGLPDLSRVPVRPGVPGFRATWKKGSFALVTFVNGDPGRPVVVGGDAPDSPGWVPDELSLRAADMRVDVLESLIKLGTESGAGLDFVALAAKVNDNFARIDSVFQGAPPKWVPVASDGGAALKAAWALEFSALDPIADVAAANVKAS
jgi:hypothetical protein